MPENIWFERKNYVEVYITQVFGVSVNIGLLVANFTNGRSVYTGHFCPVKYQEINYD